MEENSIIKEISFKEFKFDVRLLSS